MNALAKPKATGPETIEVPETIETTADRCHYMISAAIDIMESTFGDQQLHEQMIGKKNVFYCPREQIDLIMYLLYDVATNAIKIREVITPKAKRCG